MDDDMGDLWLDDGDVRRTRPMAKKGRSGWWYVGVVVLSLAAAAIVYALVVEFV